MNIFWRSKFKQEGNKYIFLQGHGWILPLLLRTLRKSEK